MFYAIYVPPDGESKHDTQYLIFDNIKEASTALKHNKGSRMYLFDTHEKANDFISNPEANISAADLSATFERLTINKEPATPADESSGSDYPSVATGQLNTLRRQIEAGDYEKVEEAISSNPRYLITVSDTAVYLMAGPKYNACHIAARANKPDIMALILDSVSNVNFMRKLYPEESDQNIQDRTNHLLDSYLNTPDPRQGNTPLHFACKLGHYRVVRVLLTFEGCDLTLKDSQNQTAEESICQSFGASKCPGGDEETIRDKIKEMFKKRLNLPKYRDQLKKRLLLKRRQSLAGGDQDSFEI